MIGIRQSLVTKTFTSRVVPPQPRHKSSSKTLRRNKQPPALTANPPLPPKPKPTQSDTKPRRPHKNALLETPPPSYSAFANKNEENGPKFREIILNSINPTPKQDLSSTRPAEIGSPDGPERDDGGNVTTAARAKYLYSLGKAYLTFYKTGLKNIWNNRKEYNEIKSRLGPISPEEAALYGGQPLNENDPQTVVPTITRREYQLYLRTRHDLLKLVPFGLVFMICGEFTPLIIPILGSRVVPFTCRIPQQVQSDRRWIQKRISHDAAGKLQSQIDAFNKNDPSFERWRWASALAFLHGVSNLVSPLPVIGRLFYRLWVEPRLVRRGWEILSDTVLICREGGFEKLGTIEICEYANKFFCPPFMWANSRRLEHTGQILWDDGIAKKLIPVLENHATFMLAVDWTCYPENQRFEQGWIWDSSSMSDLLEFQRTGKRPWKYEQEA